MKIHVRLKSDNHGGERSLLDYRGNMMGALKGEKINNSGGTGRLGVRQCCWTPVCVEGNTEGLLIKYGLSDLLLIARSGNCTQKNDVFNVTLWRKFNVIVTCNEMFSIMLSLCE